MADISGRNPDEGQTDPPRYTPPPDFTSSDSASPDAAPSPGPPVSPRAYPSPPPPASYLPPSSTPPPSASPPPFPSASPPSYPSASPPSYPSASPPSYPSASPPPYPPAGPPSYPPAGPYAQGPYAQGPVSPRPPPYAPGGSYAPGPPAGSAGGPYAPSAPYGSGSPYAPAGSSAPAGPYASGSPYAPDGSYAPGGSPGTPSTPYASGGPYAPVGPAGVSSTPYAPGASYTPGGPYAPASPQSPPGAARRRRRGPLAITLSAVAALACLAVALVSGNVARAELVRKPRTAELTAAAALGLAQRWERDPSGTIFLAKIGYGTDLLTNETATRVGIGTTDSCAASLDDTLTSLAARYSCRAAVRASYIDALDGVVYTIGVLAFPDATAAAKFYNQMPAGGFPATGLRALALPGTPAAMFDDAARQASAAKHTGPYVLLAVAGYADGRSASSTGEQRPSAFAPAGQLLTAVAAPLSQAEVPNCKDKSEWSC